MELTGNPDLEHEWNSTTVLVGLTDHQIIGLQFETEYQVRVRAESSTTGSGCEYGPTTNTMCGPWAEATGTTAGPNEAPVPIQDGDNIVLQVEATHDINASHYFSDPDGDTLTFTATSQNLSVVTVGPARLVGPDTFFTITAVAAGTANISLSATDPPGLSATILLQVTVQEEPLPVAPEVPIEVEAFIGPDGPAVGWDAPPPIVGADIMYYEVSWRDDANPVWRDPVRLGNTERSWTAPATATPGTTYEFRVRAVSDEGAESPWSAAASVTVPVPEAPGVPTEVEAFLDANRPTVTWEPPEPVDGVVITGYDVWWRDDTNRVWSEPERVGAAVRSWTASTTAVPGRTYEFRVRAVSATETGPWSNSASVTAPLPGAPGAPTQVEAFLGASGPAVTWEPPAPTDGATIAGYDISWRDDVNRVWTNPVRVGPDARSWAPGTIAVPGRRYEFRVRAVSDRDLAGPWSATASITVPELPVPGVPLNLVLVSEAGDVIGSWDEPANIDEIPVTSYTLRFRGTGLNDRWRTITVDGDVLEARVSASYGLERGGTYRAQVRGSGAGGDGPWSNEAETTIPLTGPVPVITADIRAPANRPFNITVTFSEPVTGFTVNDIQIDGVGGTASGFSGNGAVYTAVITPADSGLLTIDIPFGAALNGDRYESEAAIQFEIEVDITPPVGWITTEQTGPFTAAFTIRIIFSEPIQDLAFKDFSVTLGSVSDLVPADGSETEYTALVTPVGTGTLTIVIGPRTFYDYSAHWNTEAVSFEVEIDTVAPTVSISSTSQPPVTGPFALAFTFSEEVYGFSLDDIEFPTGAGWMQTLHNTSPTTYTGTARPTVTGQVLVRVPAFAATDAIGHGNEPAEFEITAVIDDAPRGPTARIWRTGDSRAPVYGPFEIQIDFSTTVVGMTADKLVVENGSVNPLTEAPGSEQTSYSTIVYPELSRASTVTINLPEGAVTDEVGNPNPAAPELVVEVFTPVPAVPTAGLVLLGATLAAAGCRRRRRNAAA